MNKQPTHAAPKVALDDVKQPGDYWMSHERSTLAMCCPGCGTVHAMQLRPLREGQRGPSWTCTIDGDGITLHPSVNCIGCCGWHGWLKQGVWRHC